MKSWLESISAERVRTADEFELGATVFRPTDRSERGTLVIAGAVGVAQERYADLARHLTRSGWAVVTFDYRGLGASPARPREFSRITMQQWGEYDLEAMLEWTRTRLPGNRRAALGHSIGGQLLGLTRGHASLDAVAMVASQKGYWPLWPAARKYALYAFWRFFVPFAVAATGRLPLRWRGLLDLPPGAARDWARWGLHDEYFDSEYRGLANRFANVTTPILGISVADDPTYAPKLSVDHLFQRYYTAAPTLRCHIVAEQYGLPAVGHSGFFRSNIAPKEWWDELSAWLGGASRADMFAGLRGDGPRSLSRALESAPPREAFEDALGVAHA